jgi:hypothetical protein
VKRSPAADVGGPGRVLDTWPGPNRQLDQAKEAAVLYVIGLLALVVLGAAIMLSWWLTRHPTPPAPEPRTRRDPYSQVKRHQPQERRRDE